jgi:hypothetical protein
MCTKTITGTSNNNAFGATTVNRSGVATTTASGATLAAPTVIDSANTDTASDIVCINNGTQGGNYRGVNIGSNVTLALGPATYVINTGDLSMNSTGAKISCSGCTIILTDYVTSSGAGIGAIKLTGGNIDLKAPTSSTRANTAYDYTGIALMQDRRATDTRPSSPNNTVNGNNGTSVTGVIYVPNQALKYSGGSSTTSACVQIVAKRTTFTGNSNIKAGSQCAMAGMRTIGTGSSANRKVRLVS